MAIRRAFATILFVIAFLVLAFTLFGACGNAAVEAFDKTYDTPAKWWWSFAAWSGITFGLFAGAFKLWQR